ncbi:pyridoxamine 5'-phosphate oxidase family protein [Actinoallomurus sp. CA-142502]|uniref:pyridoxamine 5'-phosphate oxidase family protein n=1 Tax=Actinoallomurus sp. CA-142502 TaxID=3239885 RepID=UPI003D8CF2BF
MPEPARTPEQRKQDTLRRLEVDEDAWVATAGDDGPYLVPLSFLWDGATLLLSTPSSSPTARNLSATGRARLGVGPTRDVVMIEGTVEMVEVDRDAGDAFAAKNGFDPRGLTGYAYFRVRPTRIQAWREANEIAGRDLMRDGRWTVA